MKLKSFGCSFIFGTDLQDNGRRDILAKPSQYTWPALLSKHLDYDYECYARPGTGNLHILENILSEASDPEPAFFVIGWTWIDRFDYTITVSGFNTKDQWKTIVPVDNTETAKVYYKNLHSQYRDKLTTLIYIKTAVDSLQQSGHRFIMTYMDNLIWETRWHCNAAIAKLQDYIKPYFIDFDGKTFLDWSRQQGYTISDMLHPLEDAHRAAADKILAHWNDYIRP